MTNYKSLSKYVCLLIVFCGLAIHAANCQTSPPAKQNITQALLDTDKFSIAIPEGWAHSNRVTNGYNAIFLMAPRADDFSPNINIISVSADGATMDEIVKGNMEDMKKANMVLGDVSDFEANGTNGRCFNSTLKYKDLDVALKTYLFIKNKMCYVVTSACLLKQKDTYGPVFDSTVKTFKLK